AADQNQSASTSQVSTTVDEPLKNEIKTALRKAAGFYREKVASHGGYVYHYSVDLSQRWGEGVASKDQIWVQPPGTPTVGMAYLKAYAASGDRYYLDAATDAAEALVYGQISTGGWTNCIDFNPRGNKVAQYRNGKGRGRTTSSLDDGQTQSAIRFLVLTDEALQFKNKKIRESVKIAFDALLAAQFPNGGFPQIWDGTKVPDPPVLKANYPKYDWRTEGRIKEYWHMYTLNDNVTGYVTQTLLEAYRVYKDDRYLTATKRLGDFLILAQMPDPQPGWAQQYNYDMQPIWARKFEPPGISGDETQETIETLMTISEATGDKKYLAPIPAALAWLKRSLLPDGRLARYYELQTNKPLYMFRNGDVYKLTYDDSNLPGHYGWKWDSRIEELETKYKQRLAADKVEAEAAISEQEVREILSSLDAEGRWISKFGNQPLVGALKLPPGTPYLSSEVFSRNVTLLSEFLESTR
ncbi:MAG TPA: pectate lyase, partial [Planctomycetaceae bacterium]|nr:pectate lyase [Planctomycetaceae bacterium]